MSSLCHITVIFGKMPVTNHTKRCFFIKSILFAQRVYTQMSRFNILMHELHTNPGDFFFFCGPFTILRKKTHQNVLHSIYYIFERFLINTLLSSSFRNKHNLINQNKAE